MVGMSTEQNTERTRRGTDLYSTTPPGFRVSEALWAVSNSPALARACERASFPRRPAACAPDRPCADAIFYVLRTGCKWQALDQTELVPHSTAMVGIRSGCRRTF